MKFKPQTTLAPGQHLIGEDTKSISVHQHIDNGGHTLTMDQYGNLIVETGFFGYSHTAVMLSTVDINGMIEFLVKAKQFIAENAEV